MLKLWQEWDASNCPCYDAYEDACHGPDTSVIPICRRRIGLLQRWMESVENQPGVCNTVWSYLFDWRVGSQHYTSSGFQLQPILNWEWLEGTH
jgi:hypothetical protein